MQVSWWTWEKKGDCVERKSSAHSRCLLQSFVDNEEERMEEDGGS